MNRHRTTARGVALLVLVAGLAAAPAGARTRVMVQPIVFPVVGPVTYADDFGQPRPGGPHQGNDLMAPRKAIAVAAEGGTVKFWTTSLAAGCMLYLKGNSGTMYEYIHLNNDLTAGNDNRGKCVAGVAYAPGLKDGARVQAGQQVGYVGDSGDANGIATHLHFEVHQNGGKAVDPYPFLQAATPLLFYAKPGSPFVLSLTGTVVTATADKLQVQVTTLQSWPSGLTVTKLVKPLTLAVPATATVQQKPGGPGGMRLLSAYEGQPVVVWTQPALASLKAERGDDGALTAALVQLG
ncbi:MAG: M23 family metallopeptidase [Actinobacteria bacterium]|nr:MAG: M23 family metallopeptidase [Actinomycetota bacterium]